MRAAFLLILLACSCPAAAKDSLVIGVAQFPASLHPFIGSQTVQDYAVNTAQRPMTTHGSNGTLVCLLCTDVPALDNGLAKREGEGLAVTLKLRPGLQWGDGAPVTAQDILFTWKVASDPASGFANVHPWTRATSVDVVDAHTAVLHLAHTDVSFALWDQILPEHIEGPVYADAKAPGDYINHTLYNREPTTPGLWDGPFNVSGYQSNDHVTFTRNPHWVGKAPGLASITMRLLENTAALQANLLSGDIDMTPEGIGITIDQAASLEKQYAARFRFNYVPLLSYEHIDVNFDNPALQDLRVRQALLHAIDVPGIVNRLFNGHAEVARSFIDGLDPHFITDVPTYAYDPAKARALLDDAGWRPGPDGIRRNDKGDRLSFDFATTSGNRVRELTQQVMQSQWKQVGVEVAIKNQPSRTFFGQLLKHREFQGLVEFASTLEVNLPPFTRLQSAYIPSAANNWGGQNYPGIRDPKLDALLQAALFELDPAKQQAIWSEMQRIYAGQLYALPLYFRTDPDILPKWLTGYVATGKENQPTDFAEDWGSE